MSHSLDSEEDNAPGALTQHQQLSRMMKQGRSWSGRERNCSYLNTGEKRFANISSVSGFDFADDARAIAPIDWDQDGDLDFWVSNRNAPRLRLMRNEQNGTNNFVTVRLEGTDSNKDAIGARIEVRATVGGKQTKLLRTVRAGEGFLSQSSRWMHFGLGDAKAIDEVKVRWPSGAVETFSGLEIDARYRLVEGAGRAEMREPLVDGAGLNLAVQEVPDQPSTARIPLVTLLPVPSLPYESFDGESVDLPLGQGKPVLINLWASWCQPCRVELKEFHDHWDELSQSGLEIVALSVDGLGDDETPLAKSAAVVRKSQFPFTTGRATSGLLSMLQHMHNSLTPMERSLPVPTSFLVDAKGRLSVIYKGRVEVSTVLGDLNHSERARSDRFLVSTPLSGSVIEHPLVSNSADAAETKVRFQFARDVEQAGLLEDARVQYQAVVDLVPDFVEAHNNLALVLSRQSRWADAIRHLEVAAKIRPDLPDTAFNMGAVYERKGDHQAAAIHYGRASEIRPDYPRAHNARGLLLAQGGNLPGALEEFRKEAEVNPTFAEAYNNVGLVLLQQSEAVQAIGHFEKAIDRDPAYADAYNNMGIAYRRLGEDGRAQGFYEEAVRLQPGFAEARNNLGLVLMRQGRLPQARQQFLAALKAQPNFGPAKQNLQKVTAMMNRR